MKTQRLWVGLLLIASAFLSHANDAILVSPVGQASQPPPPWRVVALPKQKPPLTQFDNIVIDGQSVLRVVSNQSYGNLIHPVAARDAAAHRLSWEWRVDKAPAGNLKQRDGDDVALKVCVLFDWPLARLSTFDRFKLEAAQVLVGEALPTATLCYVWDAQLPAGTVLPNAYTRRLQMVALEGEGARLTHWTRHQRDLAVDFRKAFAKEWRDGDITPPVRAVLVGGDADNTGGEGLGYLRAIALER